jgi:hypothetical protein
VWLSLTDQGSEGRWTLIVKPDDLERWQTILEHFGIRNASAYRSQLVTRRALPALNICSRMWARTMRDGVGPHHLNDEFGEADVLLEVSWFRERVQSQGPSKARPCRPCGVRIGFGVGAMAQGPELDGIWAGTRRRERRTMRKQSA